MRQILDKGWIYGIDRNMAKTKSRASTGPKWVNEFKAASAAATGAKRILNKYFGSLSQVSEKFQAGLVSEADRESEKFIIQTLRKKFPSHEFLGEETGLSYALKPAIKVGKNGLQSVKWVIDPLDGTTNYVHQFPFFCISIALQVDGEVVLGIVDAPKMNMRFHAIRGQGAYLNNKKIRVSKRKTFHDSLFATGFTERDREIEKQMKLCAHIVKNSRGLRRAGAAALDLCFVALGVFDLFWEKHLMPWDTAAGALIASEAGALVTNLEGTTYEIEMPHIAAGNPFVHGDFVTLYRDL